MLQGMSWVPHWDPEGIFFPQNIAIYNQVGMFVEDFQFLG